MTAITSYGNFTNFEPAALTLADSVSAALGEWAGDYDLDAIADGLRTEINAALPEGVTLNGDELYGPYDRRDEEIDYRAIWEGIDFWAIADKHDNSTSAAGHSE